MYVLVGFNTFMTRIKLWFFFKLKLFSILACPIPEKATQGAIGTKFGDFNEKEECSHRDSNPGEWMAPSSSAVIFFALGKHD